MTHRIAIDVGGTFTDFALIDDATGQIRIGKRLTSPGDPSQSVLDGVDEMASSAGITAAALTEALHATTIATNTVIQRKGRRTAMLTTEGFRDILVIARQKRWELYDNAQDKPQHVVRRSHTWEIPERMRYDGTVHRTLDEQAVRDAARQMLEAGIESVAICFLHSYVNPAHEQRAAAILRDAAPSLLLSLSSEVSPLYREYERASTTALNAYVMPSVSSYISRLSDGLGARGFTRKLYIMQSNGGVATPDIVARFPIRIIESGPAAGVLTAARYAEAAGTGNILSFDMGGTTAKLCLIEDGRPTLSSQFEVDTIRLKKNSGLPINIPAVDLVEIGAGGGSIARVEMGAIAVGPESAGSVPGPVCYARGGTQPTVTDADLVLGYLDPGYFLGGEMALDIAAAERALHTHLAERLGIDTVTAAWGVHEVVTAQMAQAAHVVSVGRGRDPRQFAFVPFGGAGPVHGARIARMLGCPRVVFPKGAGVESAIGLLMADAAFDLARTSILAVQDANLPAINAIFDTLEAEGSAQLAACGVAGEQRLIRSADMRFVGQGYEIGVPLPAGPYRPADLMALRGAFFDTYTATYGDRAFDRADAIEFVHFRLSAHVSMAATRFQDIAAGDGDAGRARKGERRVYFPETGGFIGCPVYDRYRLRAGDTLPGPAIIEERESTVVIIPDCEARVDRGGNIVVDLR
jgi:N-methylhydantoinase A